MLNEPTLTKLQEMRMLAMADSWREQQLNADYNKLDFEGLPLTRKWYAVHRRGKRLSAAARACRQLATESRALVERGEL